MIILNQKDIEFRQYINNWTTIAYLLRYSTALYLRDIIYCNKSRVIQLMVERIEFDVCMRVYWNIANPISLSSNKLK